VESLFAHRSTRSLRMTHSQFLGRCREQDKSSVSAIIRLKLKDLDELRKGKRHARSCYIQYIESLDPASRYRALSFPFLKRAPATHHLLERIACRYLRDLHWGGRILTGVSTTPGRESNPLWLTAEFLCSFLSVSPFFFPTPLQFYAWLR